ncbi:MAG: aminopeptidase [Saprospiraceae bacterium]|nr:aminopeptidase [Saprospiraceae bacterium]
MILEQYAKLLVHYCLEAKPGERLFLRSTTLAEPLVREIYKEACKSGVWVEVDMAFEDQAQILLEHGTDNILQQVSPFYEKAIRDFDLMLSIRAPFKMHMETVSVERSRLRQKAFEEVNKTYYKRYGNGGFRTALCQYPTEAWAQEAGMSLEECTHFVYNACKLFEEDPVTAWLDVRAHQQKIVDYLDQRKEFRYRSAGTDIRFRTDDRVWINSDGKHNMPSGEVYTSPVEDSVEGVVHFAYPVIYRGEEMEGVTLWVEKGYIEKWEAKKGQKMLEELFKVNGARYFGEAAIGTNYQIDRFTKNILFDEKIGGTVHMAVGQSYAAAGGKNTSSVHLDMIADMSNGGEIFADGEKCYDSGKFLFLD